MSSSKQIQINNRMFKVNIEKRLHAMMRELTIRNRPQNAMSIADHYSLAMFEFLQNERIPKQVEKRSLTSIRLQVDDEFLDQIEALRLIARKQKRSLSLLLEDLLEKYLAKPENYLGQNFNQKHKKRIEKI